MKGTTPDTEAEQRLTLSLFGAPGTNLNLGVRALMVSVITGVRRLAPSADITVFDDAFGAGTASFRTDGGDVAYRRCGARLSRRIHRQESYWNMRVALRTRASANRGTSRLLQSHAVLDITGGDSFTDLYGPRRFAASLAPKRLTLDAGRKLVLLPQAYGPFKTDEARAQAAMVLRRADSAWARDDISFATMAELLGDAFDPERHRRGVDVAFGLPVVEPDEPMMTSVRDFVLGQKGRPVVGVNVSGLLYNDPHARARYGIRLDYRLLSVSLLDRLLRESDASVILINHVLAPTGTTEADRVASADLLASVRSNDRHRVLVVSDPPGPGEAKWCIAQCDWFIGARMHATIAALSSGVPAAAIAYSHKAAGVFATCGLEADVADARDDVHRAMATIWDSFERRNERRVILHSRLPQVGEQASSQMSAIVASCRSPSTTG
jgi:colanic acid/amylovoran biosynthesis protein